MRPASALSVADLQVAYGRSVALQNLSLEVAPGEFMVLLGPSGSGKSTLLAAIAGLLPITSGRVMLGGRDITRLDPADRNIALVFQSYALYPTMTVENNITFGMRMRGVPRAERATRLAEVTRLLQLDNLLRRKPAQLSGGQRQRVAIGRALVRDPELFLFDEPLSNLDAQLRAETRVEIKRLHQHLGATTLYVTHDQVEAMTIASRIAVLHEGRILQVAEPMAIYDRPDTVFVARFIGSPGMNLLPGRLLMRGHAAAVEVGDARLPIDDYAWSSAPQPGFPVLLGLRPEDIGAATSSAPYATTLAPILIEPTGADLLLRLSFANTEITARLDRSVPASIGTPLPLSFNLQNASVFCARTGRRL